MKPMALEPGTALAYDRILHDQRAEVAGENSRARILRSGMLLLVPGGLGFTSLSSPLANDIVSGIQAGFIMLLIALSLVTGLMPASITRRSFERF